MTAQIHDTVRFNKELYYLVGVAGGSLVTPEQFGMQSEMHDTSCWRGFYVRYEITNSAFFLRELTMSKDDGNYSPIDGIMPEKDDEYDYPTYRNLNITVPFTGQLRLARDFIEKRYVHMGFQKPTSFMTVYDITLENGKMIKMKDRSKAMKRNRVTNLFIRPFRVPIQYFSGKHFVSRCFSLDMSKEFD